MLDAGAMLRRGTLLYVKHSHQPLAAYRLGQIVVVTCSVKALSNQQVRSSELIVRSPRIT